MRNLFNIFLVVVLTISVSACDIEPKVIEKRLFKKESSENGAVDGGGGGGGGEETYKLLDGDGGDLKDRLCIEAKAAIDAEASGEEWLQQELPEEGGGGLGGGAEGGGKKVGPIAYIILQIKKQLDMGVEKVFNKFSQDQTFKSLVYGIMIFAIMFYGIGVIGGVVHAVPFTMLVTIGKLALIYALVTEYSTFEEIVKDFFEGLVDGLIYVMSGIFSGETVNNQVEVFNPADKIFARFFSMEWVVTMMALSTTGITGFFYAMSMLGTIILFLIALLRAVYIYITAIVVRGFLYALAPIFLTLAMLKVTKSLFDGWLIQLVSFTLQPVFLFGFLGIFLEMIDAFMSNLTISSESLGATHVCYMQTDILKSTGIDKPIYWWHFADEHGLLPEGGITPEISVNLVILFSFMVLSLIMIMFGTWATRVADHMSQGLVSSAGGVTPGWATIRQKILSPIGSAAGGIRGALTGKATDQHGHVDKSSWYNPFGAAKTGAEEGRRVGKDSVKRTMKSLFGGKE